MSLTLVLRTLRTRSPSSCRRGERSVTSVPVISVPVISFFQSPPMMIQKYFNSIIPISPFSAALDSRYLVGVVLCLMTATRINLLALMLALIQPNLVFSADRISLQLTGDCLNEEKIRDRLKDELRKFQPGDKTGFDIQINEKPCSGAFCVVFRVGHEKLKTGLDRSYQFNSADCVDADDLIVIVWQRYLQELPVDDWPEPMAPAIPAGLDRKISQPADEEKRLWGYGGTSLYGSLQSKYLPFGGELEIAACFELDRKWPRLWLGPFIRVGYPQALAAGHYFEAHALLGLGYAHDIGKWRFRVGLLGGGLFVFGYGNPVNNSDSLPWLEGVIHAERNMGGYSLGIKAGISLLRHQVSVGSWPEKPAISMFRLGLSLAWPVWM